MDAQHTAATLSILHLEDSAQDHRLVCRVLDKAGFQYSISRVETLATFTEAVLSGAYALILADYRLAGFTAVDAWSSLPANSLRPPFILLSGAIGEAAAVSAIQLGISDYLHKDNLAQLERVILRALDVYSAHKAKEKASLELAVSERRLSELTGYLQTAIERERASISREIHDDIGGSLAAAKLDLAWISRHEPDPTIQPHLQAATDMIQHALGASQRIMMNLRPSILDQGLFAAVQWLASSFERRTGIKTTLRATNEDLCPEKAVQLTAYRTAQEALTNISKYAKCNQVQIDISDAEQFLTLEISDNGVGISSQEMQKPDAFGIRGLHERAKTVGGWLDISSRQGFGTSVILSVPLNAEMNQLTEAQFK
ncbi:sensor histidine kinase [Rhodoferax sp. AJA081-3]|uniref:hybrid sensor histidine kinase/response regulator n=1 Tax=Rhodoferax sp. AJA081-3 TaxID=2752316 RepID=UPI001ADF74AA|nr:histidine kinase [Rhodoferax sp. AJA081-3]QTN30229.1 sensor histidine kinase [Rhodoferax sp. AJA081-3]